MHIKKTAAEQVATKITSKVQQALLAFSELQDNGRLIKGANWSHLMHSVLPEEIAKILKGLIIWEDKEDGTYNLTELHSRR